MCCVVEIRVKKEWFRFAEDGLIGDEEVLL